MRVLVLMVLAALLGGCSRAYYRLDADKETYHAFGERIHDQRWAVPPISVDPAPESRLHDPSNPDRPPIPPDDPAAHRYMHCANGIPGFRRWHKDGDAPWIEDPSWRESLNLAEDGFLVLTPERAVELGLLHSRDYQTELDSVYLSALALTLNRFEFALHWFGTNATTFHQVGSSATEADNLTTASTFGFTRNLAAGGQLMVDLANSFVFQFSHLNHATVNSNIMVSLVQPLLRNAGRDFRLESLTEAERNLLYTVRNYAHFRKQFTFGIATQRYLGLLLQQQTIRNLQANLESLEQSYQLHLALNQAGAVPGFRVDEVFQQLQQGRLGLIMAQAGIESSQDSFLIALGLPPNFRIRLDDSLLNPFQLNDPALTDLQGEVDKLLAEYQGLDQAPPLAKLKEGFNALKGFQARALKAAGLVKTEVERWKKQLEEPGEVKGQSKEVRENVLRRAKELEADLTDGIEELNTLAKGIEKAASALAEDKRKENWEALQKLSRRQSALTAQLVVVQTQVRVYLLRLRPVDYELAAAIDYAQANRLDLMNQRARVVDAWRQIRVTANQLQSGLDVVFNANVATKGNGNPVDFRASASNYSVGFRFDSPLNRLAERNAYRASLINYQRSRRDYMDLDDRIQQAIRNDLRQLNTERLSFEISRQSLIAAARQVENAREQLLLAGANDTAATQSILLALNVVLTAKNNLIGSWVSYETTRMQLLLDLEELQLDARGIYRDEHNNPTDQPAALAGAPVQLQADQGTP